MEHEFFEPQQAAELLHCSESWLRTGVAKGEFPHLKWGKGKIVFTNDHLEEIAKSREVLPHPNIAPNQRMIGSRADTRARYS